MEETRREMLAGSLGVENGGAKKRFLSEQECKWELGDLEGTEMR